jgi:hypothetical protein
MVLVTKITTQAIRLTSVSRYHFFTTNFGYMSVAYYSLVLM